MSLLSLRRDCDILPSCLPPLRIRFIVSIKQNAEKDNTVRRVRQAVAKFVKIAVNAGQSWNLVLGSATITGKRVAKGGFAVLYSTRYASPLGEIVMVADALALKGLWLPGQPGGEALLAQAQRRDQAAVLQQGCAWLDRYFCGDCPTPQELPLDPQGSPFRRKVWFRLCEIPYGKLETYGQIARELAAENGGKMSAQAVGGAVGHNPIALIIPCHRVIGAHGNLVGYSGGLALKKRLLKYEGVDIRLLHDPKA